MNAGQKALYCSGQVGVIALTRFFFQWLLVYATRGDHGSEVLNPAQVGTVFLLFRIFDGVTDPLCGALSDRWVHSGRPRKALLLLSFWLAPCGLALLFQANQADAVGLRWALLACGMLVFFIGYTLYVIPLWSLIDDYSGGRAALRTALSNLLGVGALLATGAGFLVSPALIDTFGFAQSATLWALPCAALMLLPYFASPKPSEPTSRQRASAETSLRERFASELVGGVRKALSDRNFVSAICLLAGGQMAFTVMTAAAPFLATELLGGDAGDVATLLGPFLASTCICFVFVPRIARRVGWSSAMQTASLGLAAVYATTAATGVELVHSALATAALGFVLAGPLASVLLGLENEAVADSASQQQGQPTSLYFGVYNLVAKTLNGLALLLTSLLADALDSLGNVAVRGMSVLAAALLCMGVLASRGLRPRRQTQSAALPLAEERHPD